MDLWSLPPLQIKGAAMYVRSHVQGCFNKEATLVAQVQLYKDIISKPYIISSSVEYANVFTGWKNQYYNIAREYDENTFVYFLYTTNSHTFIANGYIVGGGIDERDFNYNNIEWDETKWKTYMK